MSVCCLLTVPGFGAAHNRTPHNHFGVPLPKIWTPDTSPLSLSIIPIWVIPHFAFPMVVVDEKTALPPPPPYTLYRAGQSQLPPPPFPTASRSSVPFPDFPSHVLLLIVHRTFPQAPDKDYSRLARQRKTLHWLTTSLRLVNRTFYLGTFYTAHNGRDAVLCFARSPRFPA